MVYLRHSFCNRLLLQFFQIAPIVPVQLNNMIKSNIWFGDNFQIMELVEGSKVIVCACNCSIKLSSDKNRSTSAEGNLFHIKRMFAANYLDSTQSTSINSNPHFR